MLDGEERKNARKEFLKQRKKWKTGFKVKNLRAASEYKKRQTTFSAPAELVVSGVPTKDRASWKQGLYDFIYDRYFINNIKQEVLKNTMQGIRSSGQCNRLDGIRLPGLGLHDVIYARAALTTNTAGGKDGIVGEIWRDLPFCMVVVIWILFRLKAEYGLGEAGEA